MALTRPPLLARLARHGWFTRMGEPAVTQLLSSLLEEPALNDAVLALIRERGAAHVGPVIEWHAERVQADGGRTDLEGLDSQGRPVIVVEVKFGALLTSGQMTSYLSAQRSRLGDANGVLVALVPEYRRYESERELGLARRAIGGATPATMTLSWDEWLDAWSMASVPDDVRADVAQLRGLCAALSGLVIPPFDSEPGRDWAEREEDLLALLQLVTRMLTPEGSRLPAQGRDEYDWYVGRRYVATVGPVGAGLSLGLVGPWAAEGEAALWMRFHKITPGFAEIERRVRLSPLAGRAREYGGHVWLPIDIPLGVAGQQLADAVAGAIREALERLGLTLQQPAMQQGD